MRLMATVASLGKETTPLHDTRQYHPIPYSQPDQVPSQTLSIQQVETAVMLFLRWAAGISFDGPLRLI
jgi:hypothetical protein